MSLDLACLEPSDVEAAVLQQGSSRELYFEPWPQPEATKLILNGQLVNVMSVGPSHTASPLLVAIIRIVLTDLVEFIKQPLVWCPEYLKPDPANLTVGALLDLHLDRLPGLAYPSEENSPWGELRRQASLLRGLRFLDAHREDLAREMLEAALDALGSEQNEEALYVTCCSDRRNGRLLGIAVCGLRGGPFCTCKYVLARRRGLCSALIALNLRYVLARTTSAEALQSVVFSVQQPEEAWTIGVSCCRAAMQPEHDFRRGLALSEKFLPEEFAPQHVLVDCPPARFPWRLASPMDCKTYYFFTETAFARLRPALVAQALARRVVVDHPFGQERQPFWPSMACCAARTVESSQLVVPEAKAWHAGVDCISIVQAQASKDSPSTVERKFRRSPTDLSTQSGSSTSSQADPGDAKAQLFWKSRQIPDPNSHWWPSKIGKFSGTL